MIVYNSFEFSVLSDHDNKRMISVSMKDQSVYVVPKTVGVFIEYSADLSSVCKVVWSASLGVSLKGFNQIEGTL